MKGDTGYGLGFFSGLIVGALGVYIAITPEGKKIKKEIIAEYTKHQQSLAQAQAKLDNRPSSKQLETVSQGIKSLRQKIENLLNPPVQVSKTVTHSKVKKKHYFKQK